MTMETKNIAKALAAVQGDMPNVTRDTGGQVGNSKYKYATLDAVYEAARPLLKKNGLSVHSQFDGDNLIMILLHDSGESLHCGSYPLGAATKHQERGSALTYARRYMLTTILGIAQEDDDGAKGNEALANKGNPPTAGSKTAQQQYGTARAFKDEFAKIKGWIEQATETEHFVKLEPFIAKQREVDPQVGDNLDRLVSERQDYLAVNGY